MNPTPILTPVTLVAHAGAYGGVVTHLNHFSSVLFKILRFEKVILFSAENVKLASDSLLPIPSVVPELSSLPGLRHWPRQLLVPLNFFYEIWRGIKQLRYFMGRSLVVSSHDPNAFWGFVLLSARSDYLLHVLPNLDAVEHAGTIKQFGIRLWRFFMNQLVKRRLAKDRLRLLVPTKHGAAIWARYLDVPESNIRPIPSPSFISRPCNNIISDFQACNPIVDELVVMAKKGARIVLSVGHLEVYKNPRRWLELAQLALEEDGELLFVWAGNGALYEEIRNKAEGVKRICLPGRLNQQDLQRLYDASWVFFHPSNKESQGIVVVDALASGLPVIVNTGEALPELIYGTESGFVLDCNSPAAGAEFCSILELLRNEVRYKNMSKSALELVDERFSYEKWQTELHSLFLTVGPSAG